MVSGGACICREEIAGMRGRRQGKGEARRGEMARLGEKEQRKEKGTHGRIEGKIRDVSLTGGPHVSL